MKTDNPLYLRVFWCEAVDWEIACQPKNCISWFDIL
jgi:hypothetical protein